MDVKGLVRTDQPYVRLEIDRNDFFRNNRFAMGGRDLAGMQACLRAFFGCRALVSGAGEELVVLLTKEDGQQLPAEADLRCIFQRAKAISYRNCKPPSRLQAVYAPHMYLSFRSPVTKEVVPEQLADYLTSIGWEGVWEDDPDRSGERVLALWPKDGAVVVGEPHHLEVRVLLADTGWDFQTTAFNIMNAGAWVTMENGG